MRGLHRLRGACKHGLLLELREGREDQVIWYIPDMEF